MNKIGAILVYQITILGIVLSRWVFLKDWADIASVIVTFTIGMVIGVILGSELCDEKHRKKTMQVVSSEDDI
jgi:hypothetical protein